MNDHFNVSDCTNDHDHDHTRDELTLQNETWVDEVKAARAEGCVNLESVGRWKIINMKTTDPTSYAVNLKRFRDRGLS